MKLGPSPDKPGGRLDRVLFLRLFFKTCGQGAGGHERRMCRSSESKVTLQRFWRSQHPNGKGERRKSFKPPGDPSALRSGASKRWWRGNPMAWFMNLDETKAPFVYDYIGEFVIEATLISRKQSGSLEAPCQKEQRPSWSPHDVESESIVASLSV